MTADSGKVEFYLPYLLLVEGVGDRKFLYHLMRQNDGIPKQFDVYDCGGRSGFGKFLRTHRLAEDFIQNVKAVLIISDNDDADSFQAVCNELASASFPVPLAAGTVASENDKPKVVIYMLPHDQEGNLEHLCLPSAYAKWGYVEAPLNTLVANTPVNGWGVGKQAKMRMQTLLSIINDHQPDCGFGASWKQDEQYQIPVNSPAFAHLVQFLSEFPALVGV